MQRFGRQSDLILWHCGKGPKWGEWTMKGELTRLENVQSFAFYSRCHFFFVQQDPKKDAE